MVAKHIPISRSLAVIRPNESHHEHFRDIWLYLSALKRPADLTLWGDNYFLWVWLCVCNESCINRPAYCMCLDSLCAVSGRLFLFHTATLSFKGQSWSLYIARPHVHTLVTHSFLRNLSILPVLNCPGWTAGHAVLHGLDEVIISRPLTTSKINSFWNGHNGGLTCRDISIISSSPPLSSLSPLGTGRVWFIPGLIRGGNLCASVVFQACSQSRAHGGITFNVMGLWG